MGEDEDLPVHKKSSYKSKTEYTYAIDGTNESDDDQQNDLHKYSKHERSRPLDDEEEVERHRSKYEDVDGYDEELNEEEPEERDDEEEIEEEDQGPQINIVKSEMDKSKPKSMNTSKRSKTKKSKI